MKKNNNNNVIRVWVVNSSGGTNEADRPIEYYSLKTLKADRHRKQNKKKTII